MSTSFPNQSNMRKKRRFDRLPEGSGESSGPLDIAIVSPDIVGPRHGGIGTAYSALAELLVQEGHRVTLLFFPSVDFSDAEAAPWIKSYREKGISFVLLKISKDVSSGQNHLLRHAHRSLTVYEWLKKCLTRFDILHFPEWSGIGYYSLLAHREGILLPGSRFVVGVHSSTRWHQSFNDDRIFRRQQDLETVFMEEESIRLADVVISPSRFYLEWLELSGKDLPEKSYFLPNVLSTLTPIDGHRKSSSINEIVFFGRLEIRKGIILFCDAIDQSTLKNRSDISITFLGPLNHVNGIPSDIYLADRAKNWKNPWKILSGFGRNEALIYLKQQECLAVMPSYAETMSYTVLECLGLGIPFLASKAGGIPELIASKDLDRVCFPPEASDLAKRLEEALGTGVSPAQPAMTSEEVKNRWISWHGKEIFDEKISSLFHPPPTVSVCLSLESGSDHSLEILKSLKKQSHAPIDLVVSIPENELYSSSDPLRIKDFVLENEWKILSTLVRSKASRWERMADETSGEVLIFLDDRTIPLPQMIERFMDVYEKTGADLLTTSLRVETGEKDEAERRDFLGTAIALGFFKNVFGEGVFLITRKAFDTMRGLHGDIASDPLEWGFLANAVLSGHRLETIPEVLAQRVQVKSVEVLNNHGHVPLSPGDHPYFPSIDSQLKDLLLYLKSVRGLLEQAPDGSFIVSPQRIVDDYCESRLFKLAEKLLAPVRKLVKKPIGPRSPVNTLVESIETLQQIQASPEGVLASILSLTRSIVKAELDKSKRIK